MQNKPKYADSSVPSLAEIIDRVSNDVELAASKRQTIASRLRQLPKWDAQARKLVAPVSPEAIPFTETHFEALVKRLCPPVLGIADKTLANAISDGRFVLQRYGLTKARWIALSPPWADLEASIEEPFVRIQVRRLLRYFSAMGVTPSAVSGEMIEGFIRALEADVRLGDGQLHARRAVRAWRNLMRRHPDTWPQVHLAMPRRRVMWGRRWADMPVLKRDVDAFFAPPLAGQLFKTPRKKKLKPSTVRTQKEAIRCYISILLNDGVPLEALTLGWACTAAAFERGIGLLEARAGAVTHWVEKIARVVLKISKYSGLLAEDEIKRVNTLYREVALAYSDWKKTQRDRDQDLLDALDDPRLMDALLALPTKTVRAVAASDGMTPRGAYAIQRALLLELWFCSALRHVNMLRLRTDHFKRLVIDGHERVVISVPADETKNEEATEHFLLEDVAALLDLYLETCLPIIANAPMPWLFPGKKDGPKHHQTLRVQMTNWITGELKLEGFHPHVIRKIVPKIALDEDPTAVEVVRRVGGWKGEKAMRSAYLQKRHRASQKRYVELLEARRLKAFAPAPAGRRLGHGA
jgi:integrase